MKTYKYIALAALVLGFTACSQDDDFTPQQEDIVQIASVNIATEVQTRVNTLGDGTLWENNDQILLVNNSRDSKNSGTYTATVTTGENPTTTWKLTSGTVLYASGTNTTNDFTAYYPASVDFTLPTDQSTEAGIMSADRMVAATTGVAKGDAVALSFERQNAKITITPTLTTEFTGKSISSLLIAGVIPYHPVEATDYTAIIAPSETGFTVSVTVDGQSLTAESSTKIEAGKHYTFSLTVGKNLVDITNVSVTKWTEQPIGGVETEEIVEVSTEAEMVAALENGGNIELTGDITVSDEYYIAKNTTIDLNGHTITGRGVFYLYNEYDENADIVLTISGNGTIKNTSPITAIAIHGHGTLNLLGGTIEGGTDIYGTTIISGGQVDNLNLNDETGTCIITGGYVETLICNVGIVTISGGTFGFNPTEYLAEGYVATETDGVWTVTPSNN